MDPIQIPLKQPIEVDGVTYHSVTVRPPTEEDRDAVRWLNVGRYVRGLRFLSRVTGLPNNVIAEVEKLDMEATLKIEAFLAEHGV